MESNLRLFFSGRADRPWQADDLCLAQPDGDCMKFRRRTFLHWAVGAGALSIALRGGNAQTYPARPVHMIVAFPAGSTTDITARLIGQSLSQQLGQQFVIENRPGAAGNIGTETVVRARPDGNTLLEVALANAINVTLYPNLNFDFIGDIVPVASVTRIPLVMVVNPSFPAKQIQARSPWRHKERKRAPCHRRTVQVYGRRHMLHVPYRGNPVPDLIGGQVQVMFSPMPAAIEYIKAGRLRALAVTTAMRQESLPDIPTIAAFVPGFEATAWNGIGVPKNTPFAIIDRLNGAINAALADPKLKVVLSDQGSSVFSSSPSDFGKFIAAETGKWANVIKFANIKPE
jgi:tripartite-type tricarboxylate transporter receptor subunit TctC